MQGKWGETRPDLMITGFGSFPGMRDNPSARLVKRLARTAWFDWKVETRLLPVTYSAARETIAAIAADPPRVLLMFGVASKARRVRLEVIGLNRASPVHRDAARVLPQPMLRSQSPARLHAKAAGLAAAALVARNSQIILSRNAGRYLCNALLYHALAESPARTLALFVHIPKLRPLQARKGDPRPDLTELTRIGREITLGLMRSARLKPREQRSH